MSHLPLARKYRPQRFQSLLGQETLSLALRNSILNKRVPSAIILCGTRGVGKTTTARLYAKALNCKNPQEGDPCGGCENCLLIAQGNHEDVIELDGASNNGVDHIRELQDTLLYHPIRGCYKVYILDEVHMLSLSAFNALLKTLEEPPPHVVFMFATTEVRKIPDTILSRCITFHLLPIPTTLIAQRIKELFQEEGVVASDPAIAALAKEGEGSLRDALTLCDQARLLLGNRLTLEGISPLLSRGLVFQPSFDLVEALLGKDSERILTIIADFDARGGDYTGLLFQSCEHLRHIFLLNAQKSASPEKEVLVKTYLPFLAKVQHPTDPHRIFHTLQHGLKALDSSSLDRFCVENYCLEWCLESSLWDLDELPSPHQNPTPQKALPTQTPAAPTPAPPPPLSHGSSQPQPSLAEGSFPPTWEALVHLWKQKKPLQGRKFEGVFPLHFSKELIRLEVNPQSTIASSLLQKEEMDRILCHLKELFDFKGRFEVLPAKDVTIERSTLLSEKTEQAKRVHEEELNRAQNHPVTKKFLEAFKSSRIEVLKGH